MTIDEAMILVKQICAAFRGTLPEHSRIQEAIGVIDSMISIPCLDVEEDEDPTD